MEKKRKYKNKNALENVYIKLRKQKMKKNYKKKLQSDTEIRGVGYRALKLKLKQIYIAISPKIDLSQWPQSYLTPIENDMKNWFEYSRICLCSMRQVDRDRNIAMINHASIAFMSISNQNWNQDLWVILCENISEIVKDETQYDRIIEVVLSAAKYETSCITSRLENLRSLFTKNPWWTLFTNVEPLLADVFQKCQFTILFFAVSEHQKSCIFTFLSKQIESSTQNLVAENLHLNLLMTLERWINLCQVTELLKKKRGLLRMLTFEELEDKEFQEQQQELKATADITELNYKREPVNEEEHNEEKVEKHTENHSSLGAECIKTKLEPNTVVKNELVESNKQESGNNLFNTPGLLQVKLESNTDAYDTIKMEKKKVTNELDRQAVTISAEQYTEVKKEPDASDDIVIEIKTAKQEKDEKKDATQLLLPSPLDITEVKSEQLCEESSSSLLIKDQAKQVKDQQAQNKQNTEDDLSALDKLILQISLQQINKSIADSNVTINEDCINISEDDDDDCIIHEDSKLEVGQLLNMYCKIVSEEPRRMVKNPLADQKGINGVEAEDFIEIGTPRVGDDNNFAVPKGISEVEY